MWQFLAESISNRKFAISQSTQSHQTTSLRHCQGKYSPSKMTSTAAILEICKQLYLDTSEPICAKFGHMMATQAKNHTSVKIKDDGCYHLAYRFSATAWLPIALFTLIHEGYGGPKITLLVKFRIILDWFLANTRSQIKQLTLNLIHRLIDEQRNVHYEGQRGQYTL